MPSRSSIVKGRRRPNIEMPYRHEQVQSAGAEAVDAAYCGWRLRSWLSRRTRRLKRSICAALPRSIIASWPVASTDTAAAMTRRCVGAYDNANRTLLRALLTVGPPRGGLLRQGAAE